MVVIQGHDMCHQYKLHQYHHDVEMPSTHPNNKKQINIKIGINFTIIEN